MAINKLENATYAVSTSWEDETKSKNILKKGHYKVAFPTLNTTTTAPYVLNGSSVDVDGVMYEFTANEGTSSTEAYVSTDTGQSLGWLGNYGRTKIIWDGKRYVSVSNDGSYVRISANGLDWVTITTNLPTGEGTLLEYEPDTGTYIVAYGSSDEIDNVSGNWITLYTSPDLINWTKRMDEVTLNWNPIDIAAGNGKCFIITWEECLYSTNLTSWTRTFDATATGGDNFAIVFCEDNDTFYFTDGYEALISTTDGSSFTSTSLDLPTGYDAGYSMGIDWDSTHGLILGYFVDDTTETEEEMNEIIQIADPDTPGTQTVLFTTPWMVQARQLFVSGDKISFSPPTVPFAFFQSESPFSSYSGVNIPTGIATALRAKDRSQPGEVFITDRDDRTRIITLGISATPPTEEGENYLILDDNSGSPQLDWTNEPPVWDAERNGYYIGSTKRALLKFFFDGLYYWGLLPLGRRVDADENALGFKMKSFSGTISESDLFDAMAPNIPYIGSEMPLFGGTFEYTDTSNGIMEQWLYAKRTASGITVRTCFIVKEQSGDTRVASASRYRNLNIWYPSIAPPFEDLEIAWYDVVHLPPDE